MKMKKMLSILTAAALAASSMAGLSVSAGAAGLDEVPAISSDLTYWFDDATASGTQKVAKGVFGEYFYTSTGNDKSNGKGSHALNGVSHYNSLRVKNVQDKFSFKVGKAATITFYTQSHASRGIVVTEGELTTVAGGDYDAAVASVGVDRVEPVSTTEWTYTTTGAETINVSSYGGDFYLAGVSVDVEDVKYTTVYNFTTNGGAESMAFQGNTGLAAPTSVEEGSNAPDIKVDATSGKFNNSNGDWCQINSGTVLTIPKVPKGSVITISSMNETQAFTIDGADYGNGASYTVAEDGDVVMTATGSWYRSITVTGPAFPEPEKIYTTVYALTTDGGAGSLAIEGTTGDIPPTTVAEGSNAPNIAVDATTGKLNNSGYSDWCQINGGTILTIPGVPKGAVISFNTMGSTNAFTINGTDYGSGASYTAESDGDVVMTATGSWYRSITVTGPAFIEGKALDGYTNTWFFGKANGAPEFALERSAEYTYEVNGYPLVVNTDAGKLNNASRSDNWAQCNDGTTFKVPVYAGSKLTWVGYNKGETVGFKVDDVLYNSYYIAAEDGTVNLSAQGLSYLDSIKIEPVAVYDITGTISGADLNGSTIKLIAANGQPYVLPITGTTFSGKVPADTYTLELASDVAYVISAPASISVGAAGDVGTVTVEAAQPQTVTGEITNAPAEAFTLTFTPASGTPVTADLTAGAASYSVTLDPGTYTVSSSKGTLSPLSQESFKVVTGAVEFNLYYPETLPTATSSEITVGQGETFTSISDALAAVKAAGLSAPVITLHSGETYREQVLVDMPNVTFKTDGAEKATITWYYGIGYSYYSLASNGCYDKDRANTRHSILKVEPARWGATVLVRGNGSGFKAENIIFENSFNQYYTAEEVKDGVKPSGIQSITVDRQAQTVAAGAKVATERAAAIGFENNPTGCELYDCKLIGSQDTFYTSGSIYVRNCEIQGNTDYIFGGGNVTFDDCKLVWNGYTDSKNNGYITANSGDRYIFRDCIVADGSKANNGGNLGRDWGGEKANVYYFDLVNKSSDLSYKWNNMGGAVASGKANLHIYDFDPEINANYATTGSSGANVNGLVSDEDAISLFNNAITALGFTPSNPAEKVRPKLTAPEIEVSDGVVYAEHKDSPAAVAFTADITMGTASVSTLTWTAKDTVSGKTASKDTAAPQITDGSVTYGLVVSVENADIDPANVRAELTAK